MNFSSLHLTRSSFISDYRFVVLVLLKVEINALYFIPNVYLSLYTWLKTLAESVILIGVDELSCFMEVCASKWDVK